jgi:hypothetical protein
MVSRVPVGSGKFCYSGPSCRIHGTHWVKSLKSDIAEKESSLKKANSFEEFTRAKAQLTKAEDAYYATEKGIDELKFKVERNDVRHNLSSSEVEALEEKIVASQKKLDENNNKAAKDFLSGQTPEERAKDVFVTDDKEKLALYLQDDDQTVLGNLALNPHTPVGSLTSLVKKGDEKTQMYVLINKNVGVPTLRAAVNLAKTPAIKTLAEARLAQVKAEKENEAARKRETEKKVQANRYSSSSYGGKGGGK